jgi:hypothetical protein
MVCECKEQVGIVKMNYKSITPQSTRKLSIMNRTILNFLGGHVPVQKFHIKQAWLGELKMEKTSAFKVNPAIAIPAIAGLAGAGGLTAAIMSNKRSRKQINSELRDPRLYSNLKGMLTLKSREERVAAHKKLKPGDSTILGAMKAGFEKQSFLTEGSMKRELVQLSNAIDQIDMEKVAEGEKKDHTVRNRVLAGLGVGAGAAVAGAGGYKGGKALVKMIKNKMANRSIAGKIAPKSLPSDFVSL